jgi:hypothetical protein
MVTERKLDPKMVLFSGSQPAESESVRRGLTRPALLPLLGTSRTLDFEDLDLATRCAMLGELEDEEAAPYSDVSEFLSPFGVLAYPILMRAVMRCGNEMSLIHAFSIPQYWMSTSRRFGFASRAEAPMEILESAVQLGLREFNSWYVRGLAKRLIKEGVSKCQVVRATPTRCGCGECDLPDGSIFDTTEIYLGCRTRLGHSGPADGRPVPAGDGCYHTIRRLPE